MATDRDENLMVDVAPEERVTVVFQQEESSESEWNRFRAEAIEQYERGTVSTSSSRKKAIKAQPKD